MSHSSTSPYRLIPAALYASRSLHLSLFVWNEKKWNRIKSSFFVFLPAVSVALKRPVKSCVDRFSSEWGLSPLNSHQEMFIYATRPRQCGFYIFLLIHLIIHNDQVGQRCQGGQNGKDDLLVIWSNVVWSSVPFKVTSRNVYMKLAFDH